MKDLRRSVEAHESIAWQIQGFLWEGKPHKSSKKERTKEELESLLEDIRLECWSIYNSAAEDLGWK